MPSDGLYGASTNPNGGLPIDLTRLGALRDTTSSTAPLAGTMASTPAPGAPMSAGLKGLCGVIETEIGKSSGGRARLGPRDKLLAGLQRSLRKLPGDMTATRESQHQGFAALHATLERHRGPVLVLTPTGQPQYAFEWKNGEWHGYYALPPFDRLPDQAPPAQAVRQLFLQSGNGMYFGTYRVPGWTHAVRELADGDGDLLILQEEARSSEGRDTATLLRRRSASSLSAGSVAEPSTSPLGDTDIQEESDHEP